MIKYSISHLNKKVEFISLAEAEAYKAANGLDVEVQEVEEQIVVLKEVPAVVSARQIRQALVLSGITMAQIEQALNSMPEPNRSLAFIEWEYSNEFQRYRPLTIAVAQMLGWTEDQMDDLWVLAFSL